MTPITLGVEEELQTLDAGNGALAPHVVFPGCAPEAGTATTEIHRCAVELQTRICASPDEVVDCLGALRRGAMAHARTQGHRLAAAGLHPVSAWQEQAMQDDDPKYGRLLIEYGDVARGALSFGLHVHLGLPEAAARMPVMNHLRERLPHVMALSASSPFCEGRDTGLDSWRASLLGRYPRTGIPDAWPDEASYLAHLARLRRTGGVEPDRGLWEDLRLHHRYSTLEVRIADAHPSLARVGLIVALLQAEAATLLTEWRAGRLGSPEPRALIEENKWRARRRSLSACFVDWRTDRERAVSELLDEWVARLRPAAQVLGYGHRLKKALHAALAEGTSADHQRRWRASGLDGNGIALALAGQTEAAAAAPAWGE